MTIDNNISCLPNVTFETEQKLFNFEFCTDDIINIIKSLDRNKAHGHDSVSFRIIKLCASSIAKPAQILFKSCFENECFPKEWMKANIVPVHYRPVSLFPV